ncbi:hypothetical protein [Caballeronia sp. ATUFL_M2_KS44]|uniref:hypothetical protein n=1 Tax=Caballeronia sp. ATUFL_M2_KS44 TaxID=2921767 RepID=UPI0020292688|nr:hypothetical protein [Caballeronia sp. ATUFL_M2_KS44]
MGISICRVKPPNFFAARSGRSIQRLLALRRFFLNGLWALGMSLLCGGLVHSAVLKEGDVLVVDQYANKLFKVDAENGARTVVSDFSDASQGPKSVTTFGLTGVAVGRRTIFVTDAYSGIFGVDPRNGQRTLVSDFTQGSIHGDLSYGAAVNVDEQVLANLQLRLESQQYVVRVDTRTDTRVLVSDFANPAQGPLLTPCCYVTDLTLDRSGAIVAGTEFTFTKGHGAALYRIDQKTGVRRLVSDFTNRAQGIDTVGLEFATGLAVESSGQILVNTAGEYNGQILLLRVDPATGMRTVLSDLGDAAQGPIGVSLHGLAVALSGEVIVSSAPATWVPNLYRVDPRTGHRALLSDSSDSKQGEPFQRIVEIAVVCGEHEGVRDRHGHHRHEGHHCFEGPRRERPHANPAGDSLISPFGR